MSRINTLVGEIKLLTKLDVFSNTRKREYVEARALLMKVIIPKLKYLSDDDLLKLSNLVKEMYEEAIITMRE